MGRAVAIRPRIHPHRKPNLHFPQPRQAQPSPQPYQARGAGNRLPSRARHGRGNHQRPARRSVQPEHRLREPFGHQSPANLLRKHRLWAQGSGQQPTGLRHRGAGHDRAHGVGGQDPGRSAAADTVHRRCRLRDGPVHRVVGVRGPVPPRADRQGTEDRGVVAGLGAGRPVRQVHEHSGARRGAAGGVTGAPSGNEAGGCPV